MKIFSALGWPLRGGRDGTLLSHCLGVLPDQALQGVIAYTLHEVVVLSDDGVVVPLDHIEFDEVVFTHEPFHVGGIVDDVLVVLREDTQQGKLQGLPVTSRRNFHSSSVGGSSSPPSSVLMVPCVFPSAATTRAAMPHARSLSASQCA